MDPLWLRQRTQDQMILGSNSASASCRGDTYNREMATIVAEDHSKGRFPWLESHTSWGKDPISCKSKAVSMVL